MKKDEKITLENYEAYLLDLAEGRLDEEERVELMRFLDAHPGLAEEETVEEWLPLRPPQRAFARKDALKRPDLSFESIDEINAEEAMIASHEGELTADQQKRLDDYLARTPGARDLYRSYARVYLKPSRKTYPQKRHLYRRRHLHVGWYAGVAAGLALLVSLFFLVGRRQNHLNPVTADATTPVITPQKEKAAAAAAAVHDAGTAGPSVFPADRKSEVPQKAQSMPGATRRQMAGDERRPGPLHPMPLREIPGTAFLSFSPRADRLARFSGNTQLPALTAEEAASEKKPAFLGKIFRQGIPQEKVNPKVLVVQGLERLNHTTRLDLSYEVVENREKGVEYVAVNSRFFSYVRKKGGDR